MQRQRPLPLRRFVPHPLHSTPSAPAGLVLPLAADGSRRWVAMACWAVAKKEAPDFGDLSACLCGFSGAVRMAPKGRDYVRVRAWLVPTALLDLFVCIVNLQDPAYNLCPMDYPVFEILMIVLDLYDVCSNQCHRLCCFDLHLDY